MTYINSCFSEREFFILIINTDCKSMLYLCIFDSRVRTENNDMINNETIIEFFKDLKESNDFNTNEKLLWSYFFLNKNERELKDFAFKLEQLGYKFDIIFEAEKINDNDVEYYLQVSKIEHHTVDSLQKLNTFFYNLADVNNLDSYDGFDVGNIITSENLR